MVGDIAEPLSVAGPPPQGNGRDSDTVEGGAGPFGPTGGLRQGEEGGTDSSHPVVELAAQQALLVIAGSEEIKLEVPGHEDWGRERSEGEKSRKDLEPGVRREVDKHNSKVDMKSVDAAVDALNAAKIKNRGNKAGDARRQENGGSPPLEIRWWGWAGLERR